jgi:putative transposase
MKTQLQPYAEIICYCLMPNHFHIIIQANAKSVIERASFGGKPMQEFAYRIGIMLSSYTQAINKQQQTTGSLFQQKTKAKILSEEVTGRKENYLENCFFYVHNNPFEGGMVKNLLDWPYSSYLDYIEMRNGSLCNKEVFLQLTCLSATDIQNRLVAAYTTAGVEKFYL